MTVSPAIKAVIALREAWNWKLVIFNWTKKVIDIKWCLEQQTSDLQMVFNKKLFMSIDIKKAHAHSKQWGQ